MLSYSELIDRLRSLDERASLLDNQDVRYRMVIVGGGALILMQYITRATHDIDVLGASKDLQHLLAEYDINTQVTAYGDSFPYNYEDRLLPLPIEGKKIDFYTASLEDIVIAKLHSHRDPDLYDIEQPAVVSALDWDLLEKLATADDEAKASALNARRHEEFLLSYRNYVARNKP